MWMMKLMHARNVSLNVRTGISQEFSPVQQEEERGKGTCKAIMGLHVWEDALNGWGQQPAAICQLQLCILHTKDHFHFYPLQICRCSCINNKSGSGLVHSLKPRYMESLQVAMKKRSEAVLGESIGMECKFYDLGSNSKAFQQAPD